MVFQINTKCRGSELLSEFREATNSKKEKNTLLKKKNVLKKFLANITVESTDIINVFTEVIKLYKEAQQSSLDQELRVMIYHCLRSTSHYRSEDREQVIELLLRDYYSKSIPAHIRGLALQTLTTIPNEHFIQASIPAVKKSLHDQDPHIRKTGCFCIARIYEFDLQIGNDAHLIDHLNDKLDDGNPSVVSSALVALSDITEKVEEFEFSISEDHAFELLDILPTINEWAQASSLSSILYFAPDSQATACEIIDKVLPYLQQSNNEVVLNALKVIIYMSNYIMHPEDLIPQLPKRIGSALVSVLNSGPEIQFLLLRNTILLLLSKFNLVSLNVTSFFCRYNDPIYIKDTKLEIIYLLANEENLHIILEELEEYARDSDVQMSRKAIRAIGNLAIKLEDIATDAVLVLSDLIELKVPHILQEVVVVFKRIVRRYPYLHSKMLNNLMENVDMIEEPGSRLAIVWLIGKYNTAMEKNAVSLLKKIGQNFREDNSEVQLAFLTALIKVYLNFSADKMCEDLVVDTFKTATEDIGNIDVRERGFYYWRLLSNRRDFPNAIEEIVNAKLPVISSDPDNLDTRVLEELEMNIGTLASIYLKPVSHVFRLNKVKELQHTSALKREHSSVFAAQKNHSSKTLRFRSSSSLTCRNKSASSLTPIEAEFKFNRQQAGQRYSSSKSDDTDSDTMVGSLDISGSRKQKNSLGLTRRMSKLGRKLTISR
ncbi:hypothetical protein LJB42_004758 [Komagataella kurtzmanii]|nr:hypothetical protein LJB42_004758 [Komagataella kurtzmanii]